MNSDATGTLAGTAKPTCTSKTANNAFRYFNGADISAHRGLYKARAYRPCAYRCRAYRYTEILAVFQVHTHNAQQHCGSMLPSKSDLYVPPEELVKLLLIIVLKKPVFVSVSPRLCCARAVTSAALSPSNDDKAPNRCGAKRVCRLSNVLCSSAVFEPAPRAPPNEANE